MICAHSPLACPFCRCRLSTWLRHNPDYSKFIIKRQANPKKKYKKVKSIKPKRHYQTSKPKATSRLIVFTGKRNGIL